MDRWIDEGSDSMNTRADKQQVTIDSNCLVIACMTLQWRDEWIIRENG